MKYSELLIQIYLNIKNKFLTLKKEQFGKK